MTNRSFPYSQANPTPRASSGFVPSSTSGAAAAWIPAKVTPGAQLEKISKFKEALSVAEMVDPTAPSVAMYCVHSTDNRLVGQVRQT